MWVAVWDQEWSKPPAAVLLPSSLPEGITRRRAATESWWRVREALDLSGASGPVPLSGLAVPSLSQSR